MSSSSSKKSTWVSSGQPRSYFHTKARMSVVMGLERPSSAASVRNRTDRDADPEATNNSDNDDNDNVNDDGRRTTKPSHQRPASAFKTMDGKGKQSAARPNFWSFKRIAMAEDSGPMLRPNSTNSPICRPSSAPLGGKRGLRTAPTRLDLLSGDRPRLRNATGHTLSDDFKAFSPPKMRDAVNDTMASVEESMKKVPSPNARLGHRRRDNQHGFASDCQSTVLRTAVELHEHLLAGVSECSSPREQLTTYSSAFGVVIEHMASSPFVGVLRQIKEAYDYEFFRNHAEKMAALHRQLGFLKEEVSRYQEQLEQRDVLISNLQLETHTLTKQLAQKTELLDFVLSSKGIATQSTLTKAGSPNRQRPLSPSSALSGLSLVEIVAQHMVVSRLQDAHLITGTMGTNNDHNNNNNNADQTARTDTISQMAPSESGSPRLASSFRSVSISQQQRPDVAAGVGGPGRSLSRPGSSDALDADPSSMFLPLHQLSPRSDFGGDDAVSHSILSPTASLAQARKVEVFVDLDT